MNLTKVSAADWIFYIGLAVAIETAIGHGSVQLTNAVPAAWIPVVQAWCVILAFIGTTIMTALSRFVPTSDEIATKGPFGAGKVLSILALSALVGSLLLPTRANAQTSAPAKAPAAPITTPSYPTTFGYYAGLGSGLATATSTVSVNGVNTNMNSVGAAFMAVAGVQYVLPGKNLGFTEIGVSYANLGSEATCTGTAGVAIACSVNGPWNFEITDAIGFNWPLPFAYLQQFYQSMFGSSTPLSLLPAGLTPTSMFPYIGASAEFNQVNSAVAGIGSAQVWQAAPAFDIGWLNTMGNGSVIDTRFRYEFDQVSYNITPGVATKPGNKVEAIIVWKF